MREWFEIGVGSVGLALLMVSIFTANYAVAFGTALLLTMFVLSDKAVTE